VDCRALTNDRLLDHADGIPDPAAARHLPTCPACSDRLADMRAIASSLRGLGRRKRWTPFRKLALIGAALLVIFVPIGMNLELKSAPIETNFMAGPAGGEGGQRLVESLGGEMLRIASFKLR